ncbi:MAG TPA: PSP1 C-terminal domain-containing protein [Pirellulales bacterium]|jgi:cell fate regulator YaaT (PSP1 superfamily)
MIEVSPSAGLGRHHLVRVGALGQIGRFTSVDATRYPRGSQVVVRTARGLELGQVLSPPGEGSESARADGSILRGVTAEDHLLAARLEKNRHAAFVACSARLQAMDSPAVLMEVEHLFDGQTLVFYLLGEVTPEVEAMTGELAELYEAHVQFRQFADAVTTGCGPGCGTETSTGCTTCASGCSIAGACGARNSAGQHAHN